MFIDNKYFVWYNNIISSAQSRIVPIQHGEKHHIIPKSLGGDNSKSNLVKLTAKEHFICHLLLTKFTSGDSKRKMVFALNRMFHGKNRYISNSRIYEEIKLEVAELLRQQFSGKTRDPAIGNKISLKKKGKLLGSQSAEHVEKRISKLKGSKRTTETKDAMSISRKGMCQSQEHIDKRTLSITGKIRSEESKANYRNSKLGEKNPNSKCVKVNGTFYPSMADACRDLGISKYHLKKLIP